MSTRPLILITNDDGVMAPGIRHLWNSMRDYADIVIVAPATEQSSVGLSITIRSPLTYDRVEWPEGNAWAVKGTPGDCVKIALNVILPRPPQIILSGINKGNNAGRNILYSGTVAAVIEGTLHNIPGIAFSLDEEFKPNFASLEAFIPPIVHYTLEHPLPHGSFLNVNFPSEGVKGIKLTRQGKEYWKENIQPRTHPTEKKEYFWLGRKLAQFDEDEDSDIVWLRKGFATAVPMYVGELTHHEHLRNQQEIFHDFVNDAVLQE